MRLSDILHHEAIATNIAAEDKEGLIAKVSEILADRPHIDVSAKTIHQCLMNRERLGTTGVGDGVAIPHAKVNGLPELVAGVGQCQQGVDFQAMDKKPVRLIFTLLVPEKSAGEHLKALARVSRLLKDDIFRAELLNADSPKKLYAAFVRADDNL